METEVVCTWTLTRRGGGQHCLRIQDAKGKWFEISLDRYTSVGWNELKFIWRQMSNDLQGENQLPF
jgi:hypothetical protein